MTSEDPLENATEDPWEIDSGNPRWFPRCRFLVCDIFSPCFSRARQDVAFNDDYASKANMISCSIIQYDIIYNNMAIL